MVSKVSKLLDKSRKFVFVVISCFLIGRSARAAKFKQRKVAFLKLPSISFQDGVEIFGPGGWKVQSGNFSYLSFLHSHKEGTKNPIDDIKSVLKVLGLTPQSFKKSHTNKTHR